MNKDEKNIPILILIPVFNDWMSLAVLMRYLDRTFAAANDQVAALIMDDASTPTNTQKFFGRRF